MRCRNLTDAKGFLVREGENETFPTTAAQSAYGGTAAANESTVTAGSGIRHLGLNALQILRFQVGHQWLQDTIAPELPH